MGKAKSKDLTVTFEVCGNHRRAGMLKRKYYHKSQRVGPTMMHTHRWVELDGEETAMYKVGLPLGMLPPQRPLGRQAASPLPRKPPALLGPLQNLSCPELFTPQNRASADFMFSRSINWKSQQQVWKISALKFSTLHVLVLCLNLMCAS